jgi:succinate dehydrogenase / fumarate reductase, flavoprotein subunit
MVKEMHKHQVLIVGGGMAGLRAAIESYDQGADTAVISQVYPIRSHSGAAQGGINGSLANVPESKDDNWEKHAFDTVKGSDFLADQDAVEAMTKDAAMRIIELEHMGTPFSRTEDGKIAQRPFGGAGYPRTCYASDKTGHVIMQALYEQCVKRQVKVYAEYFVLTLAVQGDVCRGLVAYNILTGELESFEADAVIFATGGSGRIYARSSNAIINTGSGMALLERA